MSGRVGVWVNSWHKAGALYQLGYKLSKFEKDSVIIKMWTKNLFLIPKT